MTKQQRWVALSLLFLVVAALFFLATGLSGLELMPGEPFRLGGPEEQERGPGEEMPPDELLGLDARWVRALFIAMLVLAPFAVVYFFVSKSFRKQVLMYLRFLLLFLVFVYLGLRGVRQCVNLEALLPEGGEPGPGEALPPEATFVTDPPNWLSFVMAIVLLSLLVGAAWFVWQRLRRPAGSTAELLALEARETLEALRSGEDLRDAVLRCYFDMIQVLRRQRGLVRDQAVTPREFEEQLESTGLPLEYVRRLTRLFEGVRYGAKPPGEREEEEAIACLQAIVDAAGGPS